MLSRLQGRRSYAGTRWDEGRAFTESIRVLRANLGVALADFDHPAVIVTSSSPGEGKTTTCCHLAASFATSGQRIVLVDLDLRHPDAHRMVGAHNEFGASDVLLGRRRLQDSLQYLELTSYDHRPPTGFYFLAAGGEVASPADLLAGGRTARLLEGLAEQADVVLLDTPAILPVADALVVGRVAAGAVLVAEAGRTGLDDLGKAKDLLIRNRTRLLGVVLNRADPQAADLDGARHLSGIPANGSEPPVSGLSA
ncbi:MAG TPA: CpsD/CapB family tyrosine-protein kinase [Acidimicrobiales bacterium]|nr:CpsD/CapB family tyrosine-protein kinase [Acidimicrobiales bacterium]